MNHADVASLLDPIPITYDPAKVPYDRRVLQGLLPNMSVPDQPSMAVVRALERRAEFCAAAGDVRHWSYSPVRHMAILEALAGERAMLERGQ
jgi:hypothetical protein